MELTSEGGAPLRQHLRLAERRFKRQDPRLHMRCPFGAVHVWNWYLDLRRGLPRDSGVTYSEMSAWAAMTGNTPTPEEVADLRALDGVYATVLRSTNG